MHSDLAMVRATAMRGPPSSYALWLWLGMTTRTFLRFHGRPVFLPTECVIHHMTTNGTTPRTRTTRTANPLQYSAREGWVAFHTIIPAMPEFAAKGMASRRPNAHRSCLRDAVGHASDGCSSRLAYHHLQGENQVNGNKWVPSLR